MTKTINSLEVIATIQNNFPEMVLIYDIEYGINDKVVAAVGSAYVAHSDYVGNKKPRSYKIYYTLNQENPRPYFKYQGSRYYLDETTRTY